MAVTQADSSESLSIQEQRRAIRPLLVPDDPGDARTAYYGLEHDPRRTILTLHRTPAGHVDGFLGTCITGSNPFQPLVVLRAFGLGTLEALVSQALTPGRSYLFSVPVYIGAGLEGMLSLSETATWCILRADASHFEPLINVLVTQELGAEGRRRWQIRSQERVVAAAGVNWQSRRWAEVYVASDPAARARRWDESVLSAATAALLAEGVTALYLVAQEDSHARRVAERLSYHDSGAREFTCVGTVPPAATDVGRMT